jgi:hypothetical protein
MKPRVLLAAIGVSACLLLQAHGSIVDPALSGVEFLVGHWRSDDGKVADTGGTSRGTSVITVEANGKALLRRDHTELSDKSGKSAGAFDQLMMIYLEAGALRADYSDGNHVIHYTSATIVPGHSVAFTSAHLDGAPTFRLTYELTAPASLAVSFSMAAPGQSAFQPIASGTLRRE